MPFHRVPKGHEHEDLEAIRREGEVIVSVLHDDEAHWAVFTEYPTSPPRYVGAYETRLIANPAPPGSAAHDPVAWAKAKAEYRARFTDEEWAEHVADWERRTGRSA